MPQNVQFIHPELANVLLEYYLLHDCIDGELAIKGIKQSMAIGGVFTSQEVRPGSGLGSVNAGYVNSINIARARHYLPMPNPADTSNNNVERYRSYVQRAVFYNATSRTLDGMVGQVFQRDPVVKIPDSLKILLKNADGSGVSMTQLAMRAVRNALPYGRGGLFVDYPPTTDATTQKQLADGDVRPTICFYEPWNIINWRTKTRGALEVLSLVVLRELVDDADDDEFEYSPQYQYRVLRLDPKDDTYYQQVYSEESKEYTPSGPIQVKDASGQPMRDIPFMFIGSENNDCCVDKPPMFDLASLNVAHYRNSADYEESSYICGQPTLALTGITQEWNDNVLKGTVAFGSRAAIPLPVGADAKIMQADPNTIPGDAMEKKERQMVALGAKLVQQQQTQRTATESVLETSSETSILTNVAKNVSSAFEWAIGVAALFVGSKPAEGSIEFQLNTQFQLAQMTADDQSKLVANWQKGAIAWVEMRAGLRKAGVATLPDAEALTTIAKEQAVLTPTGLVADPFDATGTVAPIAATAPTNPNPRNDPAAHAMQPATRHSGA